MKNLRFLLIGAVAGGAFGAKIGGFLSTTMEVSTSSLWIEAGFVNGALAGLFTVGAFLIAFAVAGYQKQPPAYTPKKMASA
ncbi:MAG: hypothetical protein ABJG47_10845 [Ekhidna sp.]